MESELESDDDSPHLCPPNINSGSKPQEAQTFDCSVQSHIQSQKHSQVRMAMFVYGRLLCSLHLNIFNTGMPAYLLIGQILPKVLSQLQSSGKINRIVLNTFLNINVQRENHIF